MFNALARRAVTRRRLQLEYLEDRAVPAIVYAVGTGGGMASEVRVFDAAGAQVARIANVYPNFSGSVEVAVGDINNDGTPDIVTAAGAGGGPHVKVYDGAALLQGTTQQLRSFFAYDSAFAGGVNVAVGDVNDDGTLDIVTGAGPGGGPHVRVFSGVDNSELLGFFAYDVTFLGGVTVAAADLSGDDGGTAGNRDGKAEIVTGAGPGGGPHVKVFFFNEGISGAPSTAEQLASFMAYAITFTGGVTVGTGFVTNNRDPDDFLYADIVTGAGPGGGPHVKIFRLLDINDLPGGGQRYFYFEAAGYFAFLPTFTGGVRAGVSAHDINGDGKDDIFAGAGPGNAGPTVDTRAGQAIADEETFNPGPIFKKAAYDSGYTGGIFVG